MKSVNIILNDMTEIKDFVAVTNQIDGSVTLSDKRYSVDAKSVIGIICLNFRDVLTLKIENWDEAYDYLLAKYVVEYH